MIKVRQNCIILFFILVSICEQNCDVIIILEMNQEIHQILKIVQSLKISMNGLTSLNREIIERLDVLEKIVNLYKCNPFWMNTIYLLKFFLLKLQMTLKKWKPKLQTTLHSKEIW